MITLHFILNNTLIETDEHHGSTALEFVRREARLTGTKEGCREGDCGACTILLGELDAKEPLSMRYTAVNSCLLPLGALHGKHVVTVEGLHLQNNPHKPALTPIQAAMADEGGTQCGFCTPGFIMSMTGYTLATDTPTSDGMMQAIDGNVCRCTGYMSIKRAIERVTKELANAAVGTSRLQHLIDNRIIPAYFLDIPERLQNLTNSNISSNGIHNIHVEMHHETITVSGGTDLFVQKHEVLARTAVRILPQTPHHEAIWEENGMCFLDATTTVAAFEQSPIIRRAIPRMPDFLKVFASTPIRNRATIAGNINNASPIGDMTAILLALNAGITLHSRSGTSRTIALRNYYKGYKTLDRAPDELVSTVQFRLPEGAEFFFNYEKVSRRTYLDIASVNTAALMRVADGSIVEAHISAGGVAPIPFYAAKTSLFLAQKPVSEDTFHAAADILVQEISPISDARGSVEYKRLLARQLFFAHCLALFPDVEVVF